MTKEQINQYWNPYSSRCGKLIQSSSGLIWHYSVALSDEYAVAWGPEGGNKTIGLGKLNTHKITSNFTNVENINYLAIDKIYTNIINSIETFHSRWWYGLQGWNCEHWGRLVVSNQAICYQVAEVGWGIFDLFGNLRRHLGAEETLMKLTVAEK